MKNLLRSVGIFWLSLLFIISPNGSTVSAATPLSLTYDVSALSSVEVGTEVPFTVTTVANDDAGKNIVLVFAPPPTFDIWYQGEGGVYYPLGGNSYGTPGIGFLATDATYHFKARFASLHDYLFSIKARQVPDGTDLAQSDMLTAHVITTADVTPPTASVSYSTTDRTLGTVTATITPSEDGVTVTNNSGSLSHTFSDNGSFTFEFKDTAGNTGSATAEVTWIDMSEPTFASKPADIGGMYTGKSNNLFNFKINGYEPGDTFTLSKSAEWPSWLTVEEHGNGTYSLLGAIPTTTPLGIYSLTLGVRDGFDRSDSWGFSFELKKGYPPAPAVITSPVVATWTSETTFTIKGIAEANVDVYIKSSGSGNIVGHQQLTDGATEFSIPVTLSVLNGANNFFIELHDFGEGLRTQTVPTITHDNVPPTATVSPVTSMSAVKSVTWTLGSNEPTSATYRFNIDQYASTSTVSGAYGTASSTTFAGGDGPYFIHVQTKDAAGNESPVITSGAFLDVTAPVITLRGLPHIGLIQGDSFVDPGVTATDNHDGDITRAVTVQGAPTDEHPSIDTYFLTYTVFDAVGNSAVATRTVEVLPLLERETALEETTTLSTTTPTAIMSSSNTSTSTITVPSDVDDATLDLRGLTSDDYAVLPGAVSITTSSGIPMTVEIPTGVTITGSGWNGLLALPNAVSTTVTPTTEDGYISTTESSVEIGYGNVSLNFDKAVRLKFAGLGGRSIGWSQNDVFHQISQICGEDTQEAGNTLSASGDCKINVGSDLIVWTKHFTTFTTYIPVTTAPMSGGSSSGSSGGGFGLLGPSVAVAAPTSGTTGQVLGASAYNFTKQLSVGSRGDEVTELQKFLKALGFFTEEPTGYFGALTKAAVMKFQTARGISPVGTVGPLTRLELNKGITQGQAGTMQKTLTDAQAQSIISLLQSFNVDAATLSKVRAILGVE